MFCKLNMDLSLHRTSPSEFIIPFDQYMEAIKSNYSIGMRFKMRFEGEEAPEQRYMKKRETVMCINCEQNSSSMGI